MINRTYESGRQPERLWEIAGALEFLDLSDEQVAYMELTFAPL
jgi:hypothetical protein